MLNISKGNGGEKMRLWHELLLSTLPTKQLLGQHRECCALRGNGWGKKHSTIDYIFKYSPLRLFLYHLKVMYEMQLRGYKPDKVWLQREYRGKNCEPWKVKELIMLEAIKGNGMVYPEHDITYLFECLKNLEEKGVKLNVEPECST